MTKHDALAALAYLPDDAQVTLSVRKADLMRALEQRGQGPETIDTDQAAAAFGYSADRWRRWAAAGKIEGAWQDADGAPWRLPRASCEAHLATLKATGTKRRPSPSTTGSDAGGHRTAPRRSLPRGPRTQPLPQPPSTSRTGVPVGPRPRRGGIVPFPVDAARAAQATHEGEGQASHPAGAPAR